MQTVDVVLHTIRDPDTVYLWQHLTRGGVNVFHPPGRYSVRARVYLDSYQSEHDEQKKQPSITSIFDHASQAHEHLSLVCANISALAKITDRATLHTVINGAVWPLVQINIPEGFLESGKRTGDQRWRKRKDGRRSTRWFCPTSNAPCLAHEPRNGPTCVLAVAFG